MSHEERDRANASSKALLGTDPQSAYLFSSVFKNRIVFLRLNDFPDEPLCTVVLEDQEIHLEDFPKGWTLPKHREKRNIQNQNISATD